MLCPQETRAVNPGLSEAEILQLAIKKTVEDKPHSHLWYRINATRVLAGRNKLVPTMSESLEEVRGVHIARNM